MAKPLTINDLIDAEDLAEQRAEGAARKLTAFFDNSFKAFHISFEANKTPTPLLKGNAASSHIGAVVADLIQSCDRSSCSVDNGLRDCIDAMRTAYRERNPTLILPHGSFGVLPPFSTSFLVEFMAGDAASADSIAVAIGTRRLLFLVQERLSGEALATDPLHPYLLYRLAKAFKTLENTAKGNEHLFSNLATKMVRTEVEKNLPSHDGDKAEMREKLGFGNTAIEKEAKNFSLALIQKALRKIEQASFSSASAALAWQATPRKDRGDPTYLLFAVASLDCIDSERHDALITGTLRLISDQFTGGTLLARRPFKVDDKGRALFVASLECASAFMQIALGKMSKLRHDDLSRLLRAGGELETEVEEQLNRVTIEAASNVSREGWCSDRAFTPSRIDSWVTVEAYAFFQRRAVALRLSKRAAILAQYSTKPPAKCQPKWESLVDAELDGGLPKTLDKIERITAPDSGEAASFLLFGPPGTGKTTLAESLAEKKGWDLVTLSPSDFVVDSLDHIERRSREIFDHMTNLDRTVLLFDEMDTLLRDREALGVQSAGMMIEFVVPALLPKLQSFRDHLIGGSAAAFFVTNFYERLDAAIIRSGRLDHHLLVLPYSEEARLKVVEQVLDKMDGDNSSQRAEVEGYLAALPCNLAFRDLVEICDAVVAGGDKRASLDFRKDKLGIPPQVYSPKTRPRSFGELLAFMERYDKLPVKTDPRDASPAEATARFAALADAHPDNRDFFEQWAKATANDPLAW